MNWGRRRLPGLFGAFALVAVAGCSVNRIESAIDAPMPDDLVECSQQYQEGEIVDYSADGSFSKACLEGGELVVPVPVSLDCAEGPDLLYNDYAWGYEDDEMHIFEPTNTERRPDDDLIMGCLRRDVSGDDPLADGEPDDQP